MQVILIDDEPQLRTAMARLLQCWYASVFEFEDPKAALVHIRGVEEDCVIVCDYDMPTLTGIEVYEQLEERHQKRFILFTGNHGAPCPEHGRLIHKPADVQVLKAVLQEMEGRYPRKDEADG